MTMKRLLAPIRATFLLLDGMSGGLLGEVFREVTGQHTQPLPQRFHQNRLRYLHQKRRYNHWPEQ